MTQVESSRATDIEVESSYNVCSWVELLNMDESIHESWHPESFLLKLLNVCWNIISYILDKLTANDWFGSGYV